VAAFAEYAFRQSSGRDVQLEALLRVFGDTAARVLVDC
jgi:hypothetical protein